MSQTVATPVSWQSKIAQLSQHNKLLSAFFVLLGVLALSISAHIIIPLKPVPITMQSFTVMLIPMLYGWRQGTLTVALYALAGIAGLPVFAFSQSGLSVLLSPLSGYLVGFIVAAFVMGWLLEEGLAQSVVSALIVAMVGNIIIYAFGLLMLAYFVGAQQAWLTGFMPFIYVMPVKLALLAMIAPVFWKSQQK